MVLTLCFGDSHATFSLIGGEEVFRTEINETSTFWDVQKAFMIKMHADHRNFKFVLQGGELLNVVCTDLIELYSRDGPMTFCCDVEEVLT